MGKPSDTKEDGKPALFLRNSPGLLVLSHQTRTHPGANATAFCVYSVSLRAALLALLHLPWEHDGGINIPAVSCNQRGPRRRTG